MFPGALEVRFVAACFKALFGTIVDTIEEETGRDVC